MVFNAFGIDFRHLSTDSESHEELQDKFVAFSSFLGQISSEIGEVDASVGLGSDKTEFLELADPLRDGYMVNT